MNDIEIVASRFAVSNGAAIDLATGQRVALALCAAGTAAEQTRWAGRCDEQRTLLRRSRARLVDYGAVGAAQRFEAWTVGGSTVPDPNQTPTLDACGIVLVRRPAVAAIAELFDAPDDCRPRIVSLRGPSGAGKTIAIGELARAARLNGMVPVSTGVLTSPMAAALRGRTLFVIEDDSQGRSWPAVINWAMYSPRPHIILFAGTEEIAGVNGLVLDTVSADAL
ncbi:MAG: ATP-binding protein, partial [Acidobacteria bacterium]|nr:ATP-binding protein [Acidobacteriota bacterium]